ncbi:MAG TPA: GGDEF domain-containing protein [Burkholderiales bacterium]|jgi:diguanylate cyclase (GGDEF)-like protein|nr:GGDEF domain-containing protein [Burkholderiales bacterium]
MSQPDKFDNRRILRSVVKLTEKGDVRAFELTLIETLHEFISAKTIRLCKIHDNPDVPGQRLVFFVDPADHENLDDRGFESLLLESDPAFLECLATEQAVVTNSSQESNVRVIHPVKTTSGIAGFLIVESESDNPREQELVSILLGFYKNYVSLLASSQRDKLTGLLNRKTFDEKVLRIITSLRAVDSQPDGRGAYCLAILDVDHFKRVNDRFGHLYGDEVLLLFARAMVEAFRGGDLLFRIGGEEFVVVLKDVDLTRALAVLERFRQTVEAFPFPQVGQITASIGVSMITSGDLPSTVIDRADKALYYAKNNGRNQVSVYETLVAETKLSAAVDDSDVELF